MTAPGSRLQWSIRTSLLDYVRSRGRVSCAPEQVWDGSGFAFPVERWERTADGVRATATGEVRLWAHAGAMDIAIVDPRLDLPGDGIGVLSAEIRPWGRIPVADVRVIASRTDREIRLGARLAAEAVIAFGGYYAPSTALDDVVVTTDAPGEAAA